MTTSVLLMISLIVKTTNAVNALHADELKLIAKHRYTIFLSNISKIRHALTCNLVNSKKKHYFSFLQRKTDWFHCSYSTSSLLQKCLQVTAAWCERLQPDFHPNFHGKENWFLKENKKHLGQTGWQEMLDWTIKMRWASDKILEISGLQWYCGSENVDELHVFYNLVFGKNYLKRGSYEAINFKIRAVTKFLGPNCCGPPPLETHSRTSVLCRILGSVLDRLCYSVQITFPSLSKIYTSTYLSIVH